MLDIKYIRQNAEKVKQNILNRQLDISKIDIEKLLKLDKEKNNIQGEISKLRARRNEISNMLKNPKKREKNIIEEGKELKESISKLEDKGSKVTKDWQYIMDWEPNMAFDDVPLGKGSDDNIEVKAWIPGEGYLSKDKLGKAEHSGRYMPKHSVHSKEEFVPKPHWEVGENLNLIDLEMGGKVSGSRFYYLKNEGVLVVYAIFDLLMKKLLEEGFSPMIVPILVRYNTLYGTGHFPGDADQIYKVDKVNMEDNKELYLVGSSEPSLFGYFLDKTLHQIELPKKIMAITSCFRSEAGSWGKDVRGIKRTHQFDKLEMDMIVEGDLKKAYETQDYLLSINEWLLQQLELPYHVINMCTGDLGYYAAAKKYDIEVWLPSQKMYCEIMSDSITTDYQSRRMNIHYKDTDGKTKYAYTVNDTGATHRLLIAILDHYQQKDGSVKIPRVLQGYIGKEVIKSK